MLLTGFCNTGLIKNQFKVRIACNSKVAVKILDSHFTVLN